ncbi:MAG: bifunctional glycosyltransferase family 2/GtrA family protein [Firmicutes bacterium]|nr:bifunctional glycosyltransferase family 2/GtrA family protein [Bacillota bacterium]
MPSLNPDQRLLGLVQDIQKLTDRPIVIVNDGSAPSFQPFYDTLTNDYHCLVLAHPKNKGKGAALKTALREISKIYPNLLGVVTADADGQHLPKDIVAVGDALIEHPTSLILGTRNLSSKNVPWTSRAGNRITSFVFRLSSHRRVKDTQTGLRGIPKIYFEACLKVHGDRYEFEMNMLSALAADDVSFIPVPIDTVYLEKNKSSHFKPWRDSTLIYFHLLKGIIKMSISSLLSAALDLGLFTLFTYYIFEASVNGILAATILARCLSGVFNFTLNKLWAFQSKGENVKKAIKYFLLFVVQMLLSGYIVTWLATLPFNVTLIKLVVDGLLFLLSYFIQKTFIFNQKANNHK